MEQPAPTIESNPADFNESNAVFADIRDFAENLAPGVEAPAIVPPPSAAPQKATPSAAPRAVAAPAALDSDCLMTSGDLFQGHQIDTYFAPISVGNDIDFSQPNPLSPAMEALWGQAKGVGGNGLISLKWTLSPDGTKVLMSGIPVRCQKLS